MDRRAFIAGVGALPLAAEASAEPSGNAGLNSLIIASVEMLQKDRAGGGYGGSRKGDLSYTFTQDLHYGDAIIAQSPTGPKRDAAYQKSTMCVAAVGEIVIEALNIFARQPERQKDAIDVYALLPANKWRGGTLKDLRPYLWVQEDTADVFGYKNADTPAVKYNDGRVRHAVSRGSAHAFQTFNMGEELPFSALKRGDFINLNRASGSGHAVIFWDYIGQNNTHTATYAPNVRGFRYFSAQGPRIGGGFAFRDAYFGPSAYDGPSAGATKDPGIILKQTSQLYLNSGRLWTPQHWRIQDALDGIQKKVYARTSGSGATRGAETDRMLDRDLGPPVVQFIDGDDV